MKSPKSIVALSTALTLLSGGFAPAQVPPAQSPPAQAPATAGFTWQSMGPGLPGHPFARGGAKPGFRSRFAERVGNPSAGARRNAAPSNGNRPAGQPIPLPLPDDWDSSGAKVNRPIPLPPFDAGHSDAGQLQPFPPFPGETSDAGPHGGADDKESETEEAEIEEAEKKESDANDGGDSPADESQIGQQASAEPAPSKVIPGEAGSADAAGSPPVASSDVHSRYGAPANSDRYSSPEPPAPSQDRNAADDSDDEQRYSVKPTTEDRYDLDDAVENDAVENNERYSQTPPVGDRYGFSDGGEDSLDPGSPAAGETPAESNETPGLADDDATSDPTHTAAAGGADSLADSPLGDRYSHPSQAAVPPADARYGADPIETSPPTASAPRVAASPPSSSSSLAAAAQPAELAPQQRGDMQAALRRVDGHIRRGFELADRRAFYSARNELVCALRSLTQSLDAREGGTLRSDALARGLAALEEVDDFRPRGAAMDADVNVARLAAAHRTGLLKSASETTPLAAIQEYYTHAQEQLTKAVQPSPRGARSLHGLGKLYVEIERSTSPRIRDAATKALVFQQASLLVDPNHWQAANELGVMLARQGRYEEARDWLRHSVSLASRRETWHNLAVVFHHLKQPQLAGNARRQADSLARRDSEGRPMPVSGETLPSVAQVTPEEFNRLSDIPVAIPQGTRTARAAETTSIWDWLPWR